MPAYTPPPPPAPGPDPIADVARAFEWTAEFFAVRAGVMLMIGAAIRGGVGRIL